MNARYNRIPVGSNMRHPIGMPNSSQLLNLDHFTSLQRYSDTNALFSPDLVIRSNIGGQSGARNDTWGNSRQNLRYDEARPTRPPNQLNGIQKRSAQRGNVANQKKQLRSLKDRLGQQRPINYVEVDRDRTELLADSISRRLNSEQSGSRLDPVELSDSETQDSTKYHKQISSSSKSSSASNTTSNTSVSSKSPYIDKLSHQITRFFFRNIQTLEVLQQKRYLCNRLFEVARAAAETQYSCNMFLVGSTLNGCASKTSDADLCLYLPNANIDKRKTLNLLEKLRNRLRRSGQFGGIQLIRATVPILKFNDHVTGFECDLNINNSVGIRNTHLLKAYSLVDERLAQLMFAVKYWARFNGINDASAGTFNSYSLALMTIFFLQVGVSPPIAPVLQQVEKEMFSLDREVEQLPRLDKMESKYRNDNSQTIGDLFCQFFEFFNSRFNFDTDIASIRLGRILKRSSKSEPQWTEKYICIEEPFDQSNTARAVYSHEKFTRIKQAFEGAERRADHGRDFDCFVAMHG
ncbi:poly(A) RNA polymerase GLD2-like [Convolutriloba macropyga]|uniref:poly(A) RNA polymerase GLD2-like n=1 Tax=Convolutriloba macropyga TaxID=536237 RepID=UPI003F524DB8